MFHQQMRGTNSLRHSLITLVKQVTNNEPTNAQAVWIAAGINFSRKAMLQLTISDNGGVIDEFSSQ